MKFYILLSLNKSTILLRYGCTLVGASIISGSKHSGYLGSIKEMIAILSKAQKDSKQVGISLTPDGPRGPSLLIEDSTLFKLIKKYNLNVRFTCAVTRNSFILNTWDSTCIYKPFSKGYFLDEAVLSVDEIQNLDPDELRVKCQLRMQEIYAKLRKMCNLPEVKIGVTKKRRHPELDRR